MSGRARLLAACASSRGERLARGGIALVLASAAVGLWPTTVAGGIAAALGALLVALMAVTGFCPARYAAGGPASEAEVAAQLRAQGIEDARGIVELRD